MASTWRQCVYGKLVGSDGSILHDSKYSWTGYDEALPSGVSGLRPYGLGISVNDSGDWSEYPWSNSGVLALLPKRLDGRWHMLAARVCGRREQVTRGRYYTQAHYLVAPLDEVSDLDLFQLAHTLRADPMSELNHRMPTVAMETAEELPLPHPWPDDRVRWFLKLLVSRHAVAVHDRAWKPEECFQTMLLSLACLPAAIRWRVPCGAGLWEIPEDVALGHGMISRDGVRNIDGEWSKEDLKGLDLSAGKCYVDWIAEKTAGLTTVSQLHRRVAELVPDLHRRDALPLDLGWFEAVRALHDLKDALYLERCVREPSSRVIALCRPQRFQSGPVVAAVTALRENPGHPNASLLLEDLAEEHWRPGWEQAADDPAGGAVGMLLGQLDLDPRELPPAFDLQLPTSLHGVIADNLTAALNAAGNSEDLQAWAPVIARCGAAEASNWLAAWKAAHLGTILWKGLQIERRAEGGAEGSPCLSEWAEQPPALAALRKIVRGDRPFYDEMEALEREARALPPELAIGWAGLAFKNKLYPECVILQAQAARRGAPPAKGEMGCLRPDRLRKLDEDSRRTLARALADAPPAYRESEPVLRLLLVLWTFLPEETARQIEPETSRLVGSEMAELLLGTGTKGRSEGPRERTALAALPHAMRFSPIVVQRAMDACRSGDHSGVEEALASWLDQAQPSHLKDIPLLARIRDVRDGNYGECPSLDRADAQLAARLSKHIDARRTGPAVDVRSVGQLRTVLACRVRLNSVPEQVLSEAVAATLRDKEEQQAWIRLLRDLDLADRAPWRLLTSSSQWRSLKHNEVRVLSLLSDEDFVRFMLAGWPIPETLLGKLHWHAMRRVGPSYPQTQGLVGLAESADLPQLAFQVALFILADLRESRDSDTLDLADVLRQLHGRLWRAGSAGGLRGWARLAVRAVVAAGLSKAQVLDLLDWMEDPEHEIPQKWYWLSP